VVNDLREVLNHRMACRCRVSARERMLTWQQKRGRPE